jgi:hypothetical protein
VPSGFFVYEESDSPVSLEVLKEETFEPRTEQVQFFQIGDARIAAQWEGPAKQESDTYIYAWTISAIVGEQIMRKAIFSYAVSSEFKRQSGFTQHLSMVRDCIFATHFICPNPN